MSDNTRFRLRPHLSVVVHDPDTVELRSGVWNPTSYTVSDDAHEGRLARLIERLDGTRSTAEIAAEEGVPREQVERLVDHLLELDVLERRPSTALDAYLATAAPWRVDDTVKPGQPVHVLGDAPLAEPLAEALSGTLPDNPVAVVPADDPVVEVISDRDLSWLDDGLAREERLEAFDRWRDAVVVAPFLVVDPPRATILNRGCQRAGIPWLHAACDGPFLLVGPAFLPTQTACYECLETRVLLNQRDAASYQRYKRALAEATVRLGTPPLLEPIANLLVAHLTIEALNLVVTGSTFTVGRMLTLHLPTMEVSFPEVLRVPGCPGCGSVPERDGEVLYFDPPLSPEPQP